MARISVQKPNYFKRVKSDLQNVWICMESNKRGGAGVEVVLMVVVVVVVMKVMVFVVVVVGEIKTTTSPNK